MRPLLLCLLLAAPAAAGADVSLTKLRSGEYRIVGRFAVAAPPADAWAVITDYDGIAKFVSSIRESRLLRRSGREAVIEQQLSGRFLFFSRRVKLTLDVRESPPCEVAFEQTGNSPLREYAGAWEIVPSSGGCTVSYRLLVKPAPGFGARLAARGVLTRSAEGLLDQVRAEIERRRAERR